MELEEALDALPRLLRLLLVVTARPFTDALAEVDWAAGTLLDTVAARGLADKGLAAEQAAAKAGVERKPKEEAPAPAEAAPPVEATPPAEATPPPPKPQHLTVKIEIGDGTGEPTKVLLSVAGAAA